ncbi:MAG: TonB-dependent receptor [Phycisphaerae bacterium]|nr:TonB-dependent receptor [Gemmatimonadaceae bacterium]
MQARGTEFYSRFVCSLAFALAVPASLVAQGVGQVTGRVTAIDTRLALPGARITVVGTGVSTTAGEQGRFVLGRVPAGRRTLQVVFIGRSPATREITVESGQSVTMDVALDAVSLTPVMVRASGQAEALSRQQNAVNIKNVVSADQMGRFPDASAPEAVQRLPGVALQRDQGEGRYVQIRGSSAATTQVTINGEQIGSPEADARQIALDAIPVGVLAAVEVSKSVTSDMDADAIGGSVNLVTKRAGVGRTFTLEAGGSYAPLRERGSGLGALTYGERTRDGKVGWLFSGSFGERNFGSDDIEPDYDDDDLAELDLRHYTLWRRRSGATASFDFMPNNRTTFYVNGLWSELQDQEQRRSLLHAIEDEELQYSHKNRLEKIGTFNVLGGAEHRFSKGPVLDVRLGLTQSQEDTPFDREFSFLQEDVAFSPSRANTESPQPNPQGGALARPFLFDELATGGTLTKNRDLVAAANLQFPFAFGTTGSGNMRIGGKIRSKHKDQRVDAFAVGADDDITLGSDLGVAFNNAGFVPGNYPMPWRTSASDVFDFEQRFAGRIESREADVEAQTESYDLRERVAAGYAMLELNVSTRLLVVPGLRFETTRLESDGNEFDADDETLTPRSATTSYTNVFPNLQARFRVSDQTNVRAAFTSTIFRPNFIDLVPYRVIDGDDIASGNPNLKPTTARNFDLLAERYAQNIGVLSAGVFFKQLTNPVFTQTVDNSAGGETSQPVNAKSGNIRGVELAWQQRLTFLPGALNGLGLYTNYTYTDSKATQPNGRNTRLAGQAEHAYNVAVSYEKRGFSGQISLNRVGQYIDELGDDADGDLYVDDRDQVDISASYFLRPSLQLYVDALNVGNAPLRTYQTTVDRVRQLEFYRPSFQMGLRFRP